MIDLLTSNPLTKAISRIARFVGSKLETVFSFGDKKGLTFKLLTGSLVFGLSVLFFAKLQDYNDSGLALREEGTPGNLSALPSIAPVFWQGVGVFLALISFIVTLWLREGTEPGTRKNLVLFSLWVAAFAALAAWLPADILATKEALSGKALAGETPSVPAYFGGLFLVAVLILSIPAVAVVYFRLGLMDRYTVHSFLSPFVFCLLPMVAVFIIGDITDNGSLFAAMKLSRVLWFYVVQLPYLIVFVVPIVVLLSGLFALSKMSKSNELISMIGAGRSVVRILMPLFVTGLYASLICLAFKYEWAPSAVGYTEAIVETAKREAWAKKHGQRLRQDVWARRGWMHPNEADRRTWFVGKVPLVLSEDMADLVIWQLDEEGYPEKIWKANRARWMGNEDPPVWRLMNATVYDYDENHIPRISQQQRLDIDGWSETPWKVLSSSQESEHLGMSGLTMYLEANADLDRVSLAPFRTNRWYIFAEPLTCLVMILIAAPLGIVYSRRGVMGGVTGAIVIFAFMYLMRGTVIALGHIDQISPFWAAWSTNFVIAAIGLVLLWFRGQNREIPKLRSILVALFRRRKSSIEEEPL
ncbi:LptF/LptG family permease [Verrucomicrobiales bacterium]|nr:LptF/LptG family permease [Verrucomicrobiales bacterium]